MAAGKDVGGNMAGGPSVKETKNVRKKNTTEKHKHLNANLK